MLLTELLKSTYEWSEYPHRFEGSIAFTFTTVDDDIVMVRFPEDSAYLGTFEGLYWVEFSRNKNYKLTGDRDAYKIFATVIEIIDFFIEEHHPKILAFTSDYSSRSSLYRRMIKTLSSKYSADYVPLETAKFENSDFDDALTNYSSDYDAVFGIVHKSLLKDSHKDSHDSK